MIDLHALIVAVTTGLGVFIVVVLTAEIVHAQRELEAAVEQYRSTTTTTSGPDVKVTTR